MNTYILKLPAEQVVHLLRAEMKSAHGEPELNTSAKREYLIDEEFDHGAHGPGGEVEFDLVTSRAILSIEPRVESGYWILQILVERAFGPVPTFKARQLAFAELTLDEFEEELGSPGRKRITVRLHVQTPEIRDAFDRWLSEMQARHPWKSPAAQPEPDSAVKQQMADLARSSETKETADTATTRRYWTKEAVGIFGDPDALEAAVEDLEISGFDRAAISVLATASKAREQLDRFYRSFSDVEDSGGTPRAAFVSSDSLEQGEAAVIGAPLYIGGFAGAAGVAAAGGSLALSIAAAVSGGAVGAVLGALLAGAIARRHSANVREQLKRGGIVLWVTVSHPDEEKRAMAAMTKLGARDVHIHEIQREWSIKEIPLAETQPDPFLENQFRIERG